MGYIAKNETDRTIAVRDDEGKHLMAPGDERVVRGDRHGKAMGASGLTLTYVQSHREIEERAKAEDAARDAVEQVAADIEAEAKAEEPPKPKRKATVKAREE